MADDKDTESPDTEGNEAAVTPSSASARRRLVAIAAVVLSVGAGAAYWFLGGAPTGDVSDIQAVDVPPPDPAQYLELEPAFVINLPARGRQRFLQASVTIMSRSRAAILTLERHMPAVRHNLSAVLSAQTVESIQSPGGIELVRNEAKRELNRILVEEYGSEAIEEVLFTAFVMQ